MSEDNKLGACYLAEHNIGGVYADVIVLREQNRELREELQRVYRVNSENSRLYCEAEAALAEARNIIKQILSDLPRKRDWLDPDLEARAKLALKEKP